MGKGGNVTIQKEPLQPVQPVEGEKKQKVSIPLNGKLITSEDPVVVGKNFRTLTNMRYGEVSPRSISGMTKINSNVINETYLKTRNAFQFRKIQTDSIESHILAQAYNTGLTASKVCENTTSPPATGDFTATEVWADDPDAGYGFFSDAPDGNVVYCNGAETCIWGGDESRIATFILSTAVVGDDGSVTQPKELTEAMQNSSTTADNVCHLGGEIDSYTKFLWHCDGADGDTADQTATTGQTISLEGNAQLDTGYKKFGTAALLLDGTGDYATVPDSDDWYFGTGDFTIDMWVKIVLGSEGGFCGQYVDANNFWSFYYSSSAEEMINYRFKIISAGVEESYYGWSSSITSAWVHVELVRSGSNLKLYLNGTLSHQIFTSVSINAVPNLAAPLEIGACENHTKVFNGSLDEFRISKGIARHTTNFTPPASPYSPPSRYFLVGSLRPLQGIKFYVSQANTVASTLTCKVWNGSTWDPLTIVDNTDTGASLAITGVVSFSSTVNTARIKFIEGYFLYWYQFYLDGGEAEIYKVTLDAPFQKMVDFWDGEDRLCAVFYKYTTTYIDYTINVAEDNYDTTYADTYADLSSLAAYSGEGGNCLYIGFFEQMMAINFSIPSDRTNSTASTVISVDYWDGTERKSVGTVTDGTSESGISLAKTGTISWNPPDPQAEFKKTIFNTNLPLYYYRVRWDKALDASTGIYHVSGIPAPKKIKGYKFPIYAQDRLMLCGNKDGAQNTILISAYETAQVFNGEDSSEISFGNSDALNCGCTLFAMYGSLLYNITMLFKDSEIWGLVNSDNRWLKYRIAETTGCPAPLTLVTCIIPPREGQEQNNRSFAIWMAADGVYTSDGRHPICVSWDIRDLFDPLSSSHINQSYIKSFSAFIDKSLMEYHFLIALTTGTVTTLDAEYVLDLRKWKWYKVDRTSGARLQCGISVLDSYGNNHSYGFIDSGYMERLEYGKTFDGQAIVSTLQTGDFSLIENDFLVETSLTGHVLVMAAKTYETMTLDVAPGGAGWSVGETITGQSSAATCKIAAKTSGTSYVVYQRSGAYIPGEVLTNGTTTADQGADYPTFTTSVTASHYVDSSSTGTDYTVPANNVTKRLSFPVNTANSKPGIFHAMKYVFSSSYETVGFEPLVVGLYYHPVREYDYE
jgi:hypothetical protein